MANTPAPIEKPLMLFRADANEKIGMGHLTRCLALHEITADLFEGIFLIKNYPMAIHKLEQEKVKYKIIPADYDLWQEEQWLRSFPSRAVAGIVLDGYNFNESYQQSLKNMGFFVIVIDDLCKDFFYADIVINHAADETMPYKGMPYTKFLLGPQYLLVRKSFLAPVKHPPKPGWFFVCFGGADAAGNTEKVINILQNTESCVGINLVSIREKQGNYPQDKIKIYYHVPAHIMVKLMQECEYAILPASNLSLEACALGMKVIAMKTAENQNALFHMLKKQKLAVTIETPEEILHQITVPWDRNMIENQKRIFDGRSGERIKHNLQQCLKNKS